MNVGQAIENITTIMELLQENINRQDKEIKKLKRRLDVYEAIGVVLALLILLAAVFVS